jgi:asparagine N-glycosylation enzyme membrane subunit Stt3
VAMTTRTDSVYRLSTAHVLRLVAPMELLVGALWVVAGVAGLPPGWTAALAVVTVAVVVGAAVMFMRPPRVLTLTASGYRLGFGRRTGAAEATWRQVESVATAEVAGVPAMVFALADGGRSALALTLLGPRANDAQRDVHERLNSAFGYRKL